MNAGLNATLNETCDVENKITKNSNFAVLCRTRKQKSGVYIYAPVIENNWDYVLAIIRQA